MNKGIKGLFIYLSIFLEFSRITTLFFGFKFSYPVHLYATFMSWIKSLAKQRNTRLEETKTQYLGILHAKHEVSRSNIMTVRKILICTRLED
jgi:hypothetical protein